MWQDAPLGESVTATLDPSDIELIDRIVLRDETALAALYDRHSRLVYSVAMRVLRTTPDAEEVLQEAFVRVWSRADTYEQRLGSPAAWLARIARNRAIDRLRAKKVRQFVDASPPPDDGPQQPEPFTTLTPDVILADTTKAGIVRGALVSLPQSQRTLIEAAFFDGYTHQELSERFGVPLGTVKARIRTGLLALRTQLAQAI
jgi:RNA polymerase sigma-70 factor (ECF subfamily)